MFFVFTLLIQSCEGIKVFSISLAHDWVFKLNTAWPFFTKLSEQHLLYKWTPVCVCMRMRAYCIHVPATSACSVCALAFWPLCDCKQALKFIWANWFLFVIVSFDSKLYSHLQNAWVSPCSHILFISVSGLPLAFSVFFFFFLLKNIQ